MNVPGDPPREPLVDREPLLQLRDLEERAVRFVHATASPAIVSTLSLRFSSRESQQRSRWSAAWTRFTSSGSSVQRSNACGQRGRNLQPRGALISEGGEPVIECSCSCLGRSSRGIEPSSPHVYGICGS